MRHDTLDLTLLLDYYGELLPEKQRTYCDLSYNQDYSLAEIAQVSGISRQGVHDALTHAEASLRAFEQTLGCCARDAQIRERAAHICEALSPLLNHTDAQVRADAKRIEAAVQTLLE